MVAIDQMTKMYITMNFRLHESLPIIKDIFHITYVRNTGQPLVFSGMQPVLFRNMYFF